jgi:diguanylate cyclase (GGDEF)-like protein
MASVWEDIRNRIRIGGTGSAAKSERGTDPENPPPVAPPEPNYRGDGGNTPMHARVAFWSCLITGIILLPFTIYRFWAGELGHAVANMVIMAGLLTGALGIWRTGDTRYTGLALSILTTLGVLALMLSAIDDSGISYISYWLFPITAGYFVLLPRRHAMAMFALLILALMASTLLLNPAQWLQQASLIGAISLVGLFAIGFSLIESQRSALEGLVMRDPLTEIGNRLALNEALLQAEERMARRGQPTALIIIDVDHFKSVNDRYGHRTGDQILIRLGEILKDRTRRTDLCFRMGGEEFVVLIPEGRLNDALILAQSLQNLVRRDLNVHNERITASFGCAEIRPGESGLDWLARGDAAMYRAKECGRDCIELEDNRLLGEDLRPPDETPKA